MASNTFSERPDLHTKAPYRASVLSTPGNLRQAFKDAQADPSKALIGVAHGIPSTFVTKMIASTKPDFIWIDVEHGMLNRLELHDAIHAASHHSEGKSMVIVRIPKKDEVYLVTALDAGAAGIIIPHVESAQEVRDFMKKLSFGPGNHRGFSPWVQTAGVTTSLYPNDPFNVKTGNNHICIIPQIESVEGIANVEEIAAVPGISSIMFGPTDFILDAGLDVTRLMSGNPEPAFLQAMGKFCGAAAANNLPIFSAALSPDMVPTLLQSGSRAIAVHFDFWAVTNLFADSIKKGWGHVAEFAAKSKPAEQEYPPARASI